MEQAPISSSLHVEVAALKVSCTSTADDVRELRNEVRELRTEITAILKRGTPWGTLVLCATFLLAAISGLTSIVLRPVEQDIAQAKADIKDTNIRLDTTKREAESNFIPRSALNDRIVELDDGIRQVREWLNQHKR